MCLLVKLQHITRLAAEGVPMAGDFGKNERERALKAVVKDLHEGVDIQAVRKRFASLIKEVSPEEIARLEQSLIAEGVPVEQIQKLCDVHVAVFEDGLKKRRGRRKKTMQGHPVRTFIDENREIKSRLKRAASSVKIAAGRRSEASWEAASAEVKDLGEIDRHYLRKENLLFPILEATGFTGPSKVMWGKHNEIRDMRKTLTAAVVSKNSGESRSAWGQFARAVRRMIFMEEHILFPESLRRISESQWADIRKSEAEIGYAWIEPGNLWDANIVKAGAAAANLGKPDAPIAGGPAHPLRKEGEIPLDVGSMTAEMANILLKNLPFDITYVDENEKVRYYSQGKERLFPRAPTIIGRDVRNCHPPKSVHVVEQIIEEFKKKTKDLAEFWITMGGRFIHIRYFPLYGVEGEYRGVLEVSQDVTAIRALKGEKRLLDPT